MAFIDRLIANSMSREISITLEVLAFKRATKLLSFSLFEIPPFAFLDRVLQERLAGSQ